MYRCGLDGLPGSELGARLGFLLGTSSHTLQVALARELEHWHWGDIVQGDFTDSYRNLSYICTRM